MNRMTPKPFGRPSLFLPSSTLPGMHSYLEKNIAISYGFIWNGNPLNFKATTSCCWNFCLGGIKGGYYRCVVVVGNSIGSDLGEEGCPRGCGGINGGHWPYMFEVDAC